MRHLLLALGLAVGLLAWDARAEERPVLVPEGEPELLLKDAQWSMLGTITSLTFSPDGKLVASGGSDGRVRLWEVATGRELRRLEGHTDAVTSLDFKNDGKILASGAKDNTTRLWEVATGRELHLLAGHGDVVRAVLFSPDGQTLVSGSGDKTVKVWDSKTGKDLRTLEGVADPTLAFKSNDELQVSDDQYPKNDRVFNVRTGKPVEAPATFAKESAGPYPSEPGAPPEQAMTAPEGIAQAPVPQAQQLSEPLKVLSYDKLLLATGGGDNTVRVREAFSGRVLRTLEGHTAPVQAMAFSRDGRTLASAGTDNAVRLWDVATGQALRLLQGNLYPVWSVAFGAAGRDLLTAGGDAVVHIWDPAGGRELQRMTTPGGTVRSVAASADGRLLAWGGDNGTVYLWEPATGQPPRPLSGHTGAVYSVAFSPDGGRLLSGSADGTVRMWSTLKGQPIPLPKWYAGPVRAVAFSPDGKLLASAGDDATLFLYDTSVTEGHVPTAFKGHDGPVRCLAFSPDGQSLASGGDDKTVRLWDVRTGHLLRTLKDPSGHTSSVWSVAFNPVKPVLASGGGDKKVLLWKLATGKVSQTLEGHTGWITSLSFSPDGYSLASGDDSGVVRLWAPSEDKPFQGTLRGAAQGWMSQLRDQPVLRHEDGHFLSRVRADGSLVPMAPPPPDSEPRLTLESATVRTAPGDFGVTGELVLTVSNAQDAGRAYWVRVEPDSLPPGLLLLPPEAVPRLEAGGSTDIPLRLSYLRPERAAPPQEPSLRFKLTDAYGRQFPVEVPSVPIRSPELRLVGEPQLDGKVLAITLSNEGTQATGRFDVLASYWDTNIKDIPLVTSSRPRSFSSLNNLEPGHEVTLTFLISSELLEAGKFPVSVEASYEQWPRRWTGPTSTVKVDWPFRLVGLLGLGAALLFGFVYYARVYRNPMVVHTSRTPSALKAVPLAQMVEANHALKRARRLDSTISAAGIPTARWERAVCAAREPDDAARAFADAIGGRMGAGLASDGWALTLPPLRLRFARDSAVVVIDGTRLESGEAERLTSDIFQDGRGPRQLLVLDRTHVQNAREVFEGVPRVRCVVLSSNRLRDLLLAEEPVRMLETVISEQVAVSELSPYQVAGGVKLENLFFGREREVRAIADRAVRNFLVVGQRQMGKSSLLLAVLRRLQSRSDLDACYVELADGDLHRRLARERERTSTSNVPLPSFEEIAAGVPSRPRVWLVDEADDFISADARAGYPVLQAMRALAEEGRAYFILAGFWDLYRAVVLDEKQPLRNFGEHLRLEPLDGRSALALVTEPMTALGLQWDEPTTPEFLVEQAGRRANLLVLACKALVESLPPDTHALTREHLERAFREDKDLRDQGRRWRGDNPLHRAVVRQALLLGRPTREEVRQALKGRATDIRSSDFDEAMDHRELSYVLVPDGEGRLYCPVPLMQRYIELERGLDVGLTEDLEDLGRRGLAEVPKPA